MTEELLRLFGVAPGVVEYFSLVFLRVGTAMFVLPVFGEMLIPMRVRLGAALAFTFVIYPAVLPGLEAADQESSILIRGFGEVVTGLAIGLVLRFHIMAIQIAATMAAQSTSLAQLLGGNSVDPQPAIGMILYLAALALAVELGLHTQFAMMFIKSYGFVGVGALVGSDLAGVIRGAAASSFQFGFILAAPFVAASLVYNLALGVINRAMPQLMVAFVGAPAITYGALVLLALTGPLILALWLDRFQSLIVNPFGSQ